MIVAALVIQLAPAPQCNQRTAYDIRACWAKQDDAAAAELKSTYAALAAAFQKHGLKTTPLTASQAAWMHARDKTCVFEYQQYLPGTIAPQLGTQCDIRMTRARTQRLAAVLQQKMRPTEERAAPAVGAELNRIYRLYAARLNKSQAASLAAAETAWATYRDKWCAIERGSCLTTLTRERIDELKASWIGEAFW